MVKSFACSINCNTQSGLQGKICNIKLMQDFIVYVESANTHNLGEFLCLTPFFYQVRA